MTTTITREAIISELKTKGYNAVSHDVVKNGVTLQGITIQTESNISPTIYLEHLLEMFSDFDNIVKQIISIYEEHQCIDIDISLFSNREYILNNLFIALQKKSDEPLIKRTCEFNDLEQYLYIKGKSSNDFWSVKLNAPIMKNADLSLDEVWEAGLKNTFADNETVIQSISSIVGNICDEDFFPEIPMYVITNRCNTKGSIQIFDKAKITEWVNSLPVKPTRIVCIPSSIHEFILIPTSDEDLNLQIFNDMVCEVNATEVDVTEQLSSHCYVLTL